jgi:outer membrane protein assembly factor BamB
MTTSGQGASVTRKPFRLWPGVTAAVLLVFIRFIFPLFAPDQASFAFLGALAGALLILIWWAFFSRVPHLERWGALLLIAVVLYGTFRIIHPSIQGGMMGFMFPAVSIPTMGLALVAWAVGARRLEAGPRRASLAAVILLASGAWALVRTGGITAEAVSDFHLRWTPTPEERLLAREGSRMGGTAAASQDEGAADWPGFRGPLRDGIVHGVKIKTDWAAAPPVEMWRRPVGPGWSSFAVHGELFYTQEQRGEEEVVACYNLATGEPVWKHGDPVRFYESNAGPGPRATPTLSNGRVYTLGATGVVNALDARDGSVVWSRDAAADTGARMPGWGFSGSPLVLDDEVIVAAAGKLVAYDLATGQPRWLGPKGGSGYSSPHLLTIGGVPQILLLSMTGAASVAPADGKVLWEHAWNMDGIVQPALTADGDVVIGSGSGLHESGMRRLACAQGASGWTVQERWTTMGLKPYFNDFVLHHDHAFGFDGSMLSSIDVKDGQRTWKGGRYGHGQLVLLSDQDLLLVLSEQGELALVEAKPDKFTELARFPAIKGKTWNHPVIAGDVLLVRNDQEMAAFRLALAGS